MGRFLGKYKKIFGIFGLLVFVCLFTAFMAPESFLKPANIENTVRWTALFGIISVGVSFVIMTGGIDLSIGSVVALVGCVLAMSLNTTYQPERLTQAELQGATRTMRLNNDRELPFKQGDTLLFLNNVYTVASATGDHLILVEEVKASSQEGTVILAHRVVSMSDEQEASVQRGSIEMGLRIITINGSQDFKAGDQLNLVYDVGLPQIFSIAEVQPAGEQTQIKFYVRRNQVVREPATIFVSIRSQPFSTPIGIALALGVSLLIGLTHGLLITKVKLQPFVVTLCGLLIYRGLARFLTGDQEQGFGSEYPILKQFAKGDFLQLLTGQEFVFDLPMPFIYLMIIGVIAAIFLNKTIFGRYILALGRNEEAARYSGINTDRMVIVSYMICSFCAGIAAILFALDLNSIQPSGHGEFYELYAIAAAVLGGCSLRGGEGSVLGVIIAAAVMRVLNNAINLIDGVDTSTEFAIIGMVILLGVIVDESVRRFAARRVAA